MIGAIKRAIVDLMPRPRWLCQLRRGHRVAPTGRSSPAGALEEVRCHDCGGHYVRFHATADAHPHEQALDGTMLPWSHDFEAAMDPNRPGTRPVELPRATVRR